MYNVQNVVRNSKKKKIEILKITWTLKLVLGIFQSGKIQCLKPKYCGLFSLYNVHCPKDCVCSHFMAAQVSISWRLTQPFRQCAMHAVTLEIVCVYLTTL